VTETTERTTIDPYTGAGLMEFLDAAIDKGWFNINSLGAMKITAQKVFEVEQGWQDLDLRHLDVDALLDRWQNLRRNKYSDSSISVYRTRFKKAVKMHLARLDNDPNWKSYGPSARAAPTGVSPQPNGTGKKPKTAASATTPPNPAVEPEDDEPVRTPPARPGLMDFPYPLRDDLDVYVRLPRDLTAPEAERLAKYIRSLARDNQPES
jgi:hypothetical protein